MGKKWRPGRAIILIIINNMVFPLNCFCLFRFYTMIIHSTAAQHNWCLIQQQPQETPTDNWPLASRLWERSTAPAEGCCSVWSSSREFKGPGWKITEVRQCSLFPPFPLAKPVFVQTPAFRPSVNCTFILQGKEDMVIV